MKTLGYLGLAISIVQTVSAGVIYNANLGTLPQAQGWAYTGDSGNPSPFVANGLLHEVRNVPDTSQGWNTTDTSLDVTKHVYLQGYLRINSSNYVSNVGTGTREGYYLLFQDVNSRGYTIGLSDDGFSINTIQVPNAPLVPFPIKGAFHTFTLDVNTSLASFFIDGVLEASNITPYFAGQGINVDSIQFGAIAGASLSNSDLSGFCETTSGTCVAPMSGTPEPSTVLLAGTSILAFELKRRVLQNRVHQSLNR